MENKFKTKVLYIIEKLCIFSKIPKKRYEIGVLIDLKDKSKLVPEGNAIKCNEGMDGEVLMRDNFKYLKGVPLHSQAR